MGSVINIIFVSSVSIDCLAITILPKKKSKSKRESKREREDRTVNSQSVNSTVACVCEKE